MAYKDEEFEVVREASEEKIKKLEDALKKVNANWICLNICSTPKTHSMNLKCSAKVFNRSGPRSPIEVAKEVANLIFG